MTKRKEREMNKIRVRLLGAGMTALAVLAFLVAYGAVSPTPVFAAPCCQECDAQQAACYQGCRDGAHELGADDSEQACYQKCDDELWDEPFGCFTTCYYCSP